MNRILSFFLLILALFSLTMPVFADIAYVPEDDFYRRHAEDSRYENRVWLVNGANGYALVYSSPTGKPEGILSNGERYLVNYIYENWGHLEYFPENCDTSDWRNRISGWVNLRDMTRDYDYRSFDADHSSEYEQKERELSVSSSNTIYGYKYPGSGVVVDELGSWRSSDLFFSMIYTDSEGREWGFLGYYMGSRNYWICLDDPCNNLLPADENSRSLDIIPPASAEEMKDALKKAITPTYYLYVGAGSIVVIAAAVLIAMLLQKKKSKTSSKLQKSQ